MCGVETAGQLEVTHAGLTGTHRALGRLLPGAGAVVADQGAVSEGLPVVGHQDRVGQAAVIRLERAAGLDQMASGFLKDYPLQISGLMVGKCGIDKVLTKLKFPRVCQAIKTKTD